MMKNFMVAVTASMAILLSACGSTPKTHYYLLQPTENVESSVGKAYSIGVGPITVAEYLQRPQLITIEDNKIVYSDFHRWAESLEKGMTRILSVNLAGSLNNNNIVLFPWRSDEIPEIRVRIVVVDLNRVGDQASLTVRWNVNLSADPTREIQNLETFTITAEKDGYQNLAKAYSKLISNLSVVLAENITRLRSEAAPD
jgi:hypothetical protein